MAKGGFLLRNSRQKPAVSWQRAVLRFVCAILAVILTVMVAITVYIETLFSKLDREDAGSNSLLSAATEYIPSNGQLISGENTINIMLVGTDLSEARSDTMILCTVDRADKTITLTSFLRDTYVDIPEYFPHKMNTAYALDGFTSLNNTLIENFGVKVDGNVAINFDGFIQVVDVIGGVEVSLTAEEAEHLNNLLGWSLTEGINQLTGEQALHYSRIRVLDSDFARANRQRTVITAILQKIKGLSLIEMNKLLNELLPLVSTNMSNSEIVGYGLECLPILSNVTIETYQIPAEGTYHLDWVEQDGGMSVIWVDDFETNQDLLEQIISG